jgi:hypothetical protein
VLIVPHSQLEDPAPEPTEAAVVTGETLRILTIGEPSVDRGLETLEAAAIDAKRRELPLEFHFLGSSTHGVRVFPESSLHTYTPYDSEDLLRSIHRLDPHVYWFPWQEPGIYSYAMSTALAAALPVAATDVGDLRERLAGRRHSWVLDPGTGPEEWNDFFLRVRSGDQLEDLSVTRAGRSPESDFRYATDYVPTYEEASVAQTAPPAADPG